MEFRQIGKIFSSDPLSFCPPPPDFFPPARLCSRIPVDGRKRNEFGYVWSVDAYFMESATKCFRIQTNPDSGPKHLSPH